MKILTKNALEYLAFEKAFKEDRIRDARHPNQNLDENLKPTILNKNRRRTVFFNPLPKKLPD